MILQAFKGLGLALPFSLLAWTPAAIAATPATAPASAIPAPTTVDSTPPPSGIERLPPSAYPAPQTRGLVGGSLWSTFHGLQWPYSTGVSAPPKTSIGISGYGWIDTGYERIARGDTNEPSTKYWLQQGRFLLRATPTYNHDDWFIQAQAELVANKDQTLRQPDVVDTDDLYIRLGKWNSFDVQVGRYEAWELYHLGMGLDLNTLERQGAVDINLAAPSIYGVTYAFYRPSGVGNVALHLYPTNYLRFELLTQIGNETGQNALAGRPAMILDFGWLKFKAGGEFKQTSSQNEGIKEERKQRGGGAALQFIIDPYVEFGFNGAYGLVDHTDVNGAIDEPGSITTYSAGSFANIRLASDLLLGAGANYTHVEDIHKDSEGRVGEFSHLQTFGALQYIVMKQLYIKAVVAYAKSSFAPTFTMSPNFDDTMTSARLRLMYAF